MDDDGGKRGRERRKGRKAGTQVTAWVDKVTVRVVRAVQCSVV